MNLNPTPLLVPTFFYMVLKMCKTQLGMDAEAIVALFSPENIRAGCEIIKEPK